MSFFIVKLLTRAAWI